MARTLATQSTDTARTEARRDVFAPADWPRLTADLDAFRAAWARVADGIPKKPAKLAHRHVHALARDGRLHLSANDQSCGLTTSCAADVEEPGEFLLDPAPVRSVLGTTRGGASIAIERINAESDAPQPTLLECRIGLFAIDLPDEDPAEFPAVPPWDPAAPRWTVAAADLARCLGQTMPAADPQSTRYALAGVRIEGGPDALRWIGCDGRRLHVAWCPAGPIGDPAIDNDDRQGYILPLFACRAARRMGLREPDGTVELAIRPEATGIRSPGGSVLWTRNLEGRYPKWEDALPPDEPPRTTVTIPDAAEFERQVRLAAIMTSDEHRTAVLEADASGVTIWAEAPDVGIGEVDCVGVEAEGEPSYCAIVPEYLLAALAVLDEGASASLALHGPKMLVQSALDLRAEGFRAVVMPTTGEINLAGRLRRIRAEAVAAGVDR